MKVILRANVQKVGKKYDVIEVADGFALNFLIPQNLAELATPKGIARVEEMRKRAGEATEAEMAAEKSFIESLSGQTITIEEKVNEQGHLFRKVGTAQIAKALGENVREDIVDLPEPIKEAGEYDVSLRSGEARGTVKVVIQAA